jgi:hypothetical protein
MPRVHVRAAQSAEVRCRSGWSVSSLSMRSPCGCAAALQATLLGSRPAARDGRAARMAAGHFRRASSKSRLGQAGESNTAGRRRSAGMPHGSCTGPLSGKLLLPEQAARPQRAAAGAESRSSDLAAQRRTPPGRRFAAAAARRALRRQRVQGQSEAHERSAGRRDPGAERGSLPLLEVAPARCSAAPEAMRTPNKAARSSIASAARRSSRNARSSALVRGERAAALCEMPACRADDALDVRCAGLPDM